MSDTMDISDQYEDQQKPDSAYDFDRVYELQNGLVFYMVPLSMFREQDINANVMSRKKFKRLSANMADDERIESTPLAWRTVSPGGDPEFAIMSGHHRIRAARAAAEKVESLKKIPTLVDERDLSRSEIHSKQLSHNALSGESDPQIVQEIFDRIDNLDEKIKSGIRETDMDIEFKPVKVDPIEIDFDTEIVNLVFLPHQYEKFESLLDTLSEDSTIGLADIDQFPDFRSMIQRVSGRYDIRSLPAIPPGDPLQDHDDLRKMARRAPSGRG